MVVVVVVVVRETLKLFGVPRLPLEFVQEGPRTKSELGSKASMSSL